MLNISQKATGLYSKADTKVHTKVIADIFILPILQIYKLALDHLHSPMSENNM